jgi:hypothetical protein
MGHLWQKKNPEKGAYYGKPQVHISGRENYQNGKMCHVETIKKIILIKISMQKAYPEKTRFSCPNLLFVFKQGRE